MKKLSIFAAMLMALFTISCTEEEFDTTTPQTEEQEDEDSESSNVTISFTFDDLEEYATRADDVTISSMMMMLYHQSLDAFYYIPLGSAQSFNLDLVNGEWNIYTVANTTYSPGSNVNYESRIAEVTQSSISESMLSESSVRALSLSSLTTVNINSDVAITIPLKRLYSKINVDVNVDTSSGNDIVVESIQLMNVPTVAALFQDNAGDVSPIDYTAKSSSAASSHTFYMLENLQGVNNSIVYETQKCSDKAPSNASYLLIKATVNDVPAQYSIYLGGNTTNDFNIRRNTEYNIDVTISGIDLSDWRVSATDINFTQPIITDSSNIVYATFMVSSDKEDEAAKVTFFYNGGICGMRLYEDAAYWNYANGFTTTSPESLLTGYFNAAWVNYTLELEMNKEYVAVVTPLSTSNSMGIGLTTDDFTKKLYVASSK
ncbi:MAG: DUF4906 domain-containing protein [Rikenellaceae bacterium]